jgi:hypothetical protein
MPLRRALFLFALMLTLLLPPWSPCQAREPVKKWPISLSAFAPDDAGKSFVYRLRSEIARSGMYRLAEDNEVALLEIRVMTISEQQTDSGEPKNQNNASTAAAVIFLLPQTNGNPRYIDGMVCDAGSDKTSEMAQAVMVRADENAQMLLRGMIRDQTRKPRPLTA